MREQKINMRNIETVMDLYSALDTSEMKNTISFEGLCNLDDFEIMALYATVANN